MAAVTFKVMIRGFEPKRPAPEPRPKWQWGPALAAGVIAGLVLLVVPRASPWSGLTIFSRVFMGRMVPASAGVPVAVVWLGHLALSLAYGLAVAGVAARWTQGKALLAGGLTGLALYGANYLVISHLLPAMLGGEGGVALAHFFFGLIAAGAYRGLLRRPQPVPPAAA